MQVRACTHAFAMCAQGLNACLQNSLTCMWCMACVLTVVLWQQVQIFLRWLWGLTKFGQFLYRLRQASASLQYHFSQTLTTQFPIVWTLYFELCVLSRAKAVSCSCTLLRWCFGGAAWALFILYCVLHCAAFVAQLDCTFDWASEYGWWDSLSCKDILSMCAYMHVCAWAHMSCIEPTLLKGLRLEL